MDAKVIAHINEKRRVIGSEVLLAFIHMLLLILTATNID